MAEEQPQSDQEATDAQSADAPEQAAAEALQSVEAAAKAVEAAADDAAPIDLPDFEQGGNGEAASPAGMNLLKDVSLAGGALMAAHFAEHLTPEQTGRPAEA